MADQPATETLSLSEFAERRQRTDAVSKWVRARLEQHLEVLRQPFDPRRVFGKGASTAAGGRIDVGAAEAAAAQLRARFREVCGAPFSLKAELPDEVVANVDNQLVVEPWVYPYALREGNETKTIRITSPLRFVLTYASNYTVAQVDRVLAKQEERRESDLRQFVANHLVLAAVLERHPALTQTLRDLRFDLSSSTREGLGKLPLITLTSHVPTIRPPDDVIAAATGISGVAAFIELLPRDPLGAVRDPLREEVGGLLG
jgi:hypothetical protein